MAKVNYVLRRIDESRAKRIRRLLEDAGLGGHVGPSLVARTGIAALDAMRDAEIIKLAKKTAAEEDG
jgi:hypothetical protein